MDSLLRVVVSAMPAFDIFYLDLSRALHCCNIASKFAMETILDTMALPIASETA